MYAQTNPKEFVHIERVNEVSSKGELKEVKVSVKGEWNDIANRLAQQFRQNSLQFQSELG
jgi:hypothetical protein